MAHFFNLWYNLVEIQYCSLAIKWNLIGFMLNFFGKFAYQWYIADSRSFWNGFLDFIKFIDRDFGVVANVYNWLNPLYGDYSWVGKLIGPFLRTGRIFFGLFIYAIFFTVALSVYFLWLALPMTVVVMVLNNLFF